MFPLPKRLSSTRVRIKISGKPFQSCLIPFEQEILDLRGRKRPASYARIAEVLREKHQIQVCRETIFKFVKVRSRGRKVYPIYRELPSVNSRKALPATNPKPPLQEKPKFEFKYSQRYSLTRLPPEEAAAIRKKLEAEGHYNRQEYLEILDQKNGEYSTIPLDKRALEILRSIPRRFDSPYVFTGKIKGQPFWDLKRQFEEAVRKSKLEGVTFHTLRHTAASHMVMSGVPLATVKEILRHKDYAMTWRNAHLSSEHTRAAMNALGASLAVKPKGKSKTA
jgi:integrase